MVATIVASSVERVPAEHRQAQHAYMLHVRRCVCCVGYLCPTGRYFDIAADAAGWCFALTAGRALR